jgi:8-oxo-dGTP pyrophosphatase MutT (NUDIX family)
LLPLVSFNNNNNNNNHNHNHNHHHHRSNSNSLPWTVRGQQQQQQQTSVAFMSTRTPPPPTTASHLRSRRRRCRSGAPPSRLRMPLLRNLLIMRMLLLLLLLRFSAADARPDAVASAASSSTIPPPGAAWRSSRFVRNKMNGGLFPLPLPPRPCPSFFFFFFSDPEGSGGGATDEEEEKKEEEEEDDGGGGGAQTRLDARRSRAALRDRYPRRRRAHVAPWTRGGGGGGGGGGLGGEVVFASSGGQWQHGSSSHPGRRRRRRQQHRGQMLLDVTLALRGGGGGGGGASREGDGDAVLSTAPTTSASTLSSSNEYELLGDTTVFRGWRNVLERSVKYPSGRVVHFHLTEQSGSSNRAVLVLAWDRSTKTCTFIREYMPSRHRLVSGLAAGMVEDHHHHHVDSNATSTGAGLLDPQAVEASARRELAEECRLEGGTWHALTPPDGVVMDKYCTTKLHAYLVMDATPFHDETAHHVHPRDDAEEGMQVLSGVSLEQLQEWIREGEFTVVGAWGAMLALEKLRSLQEI